MAAVQPQESCSARRSADSKSTQRAHHSWTGCADRATLSLHALCRGALSTWGQAVPELYSRGVGLGPTCPGFFSGRYRTHDRLRECRYRVRAFGGGYFASIPAAAAELCIPEEACPIARRTTVRHPGER